MHLVVEFFRSNPDLSSDPYSKEGCIWSFDCIFSEKHKYYMFNHKDIFLSFLIIPDIILIYHLTPMARKDVFGRSITSSSTRS